MPTSLTVDRHLEALAEAGTAMARHAEHAGLDAPVPTCPEWDVADLVAHQALVHRWAAGFLRDDPFERADADIRSEPDLLGYFREGLDQLVDTLTRADDQAGASLVFLKDAPVPRAFWGRRQAHETTIHGIDSLAASLGRLPHADECGVDRELALDGLDELLCGFVTRGRSKVPADAPFTVMVQPSDADDRWLLRIGESIETEPGGTTGAPDVVLHGTAAELYLGLWNRGDEMSEEGRPGLLHAWRQHQRVTWS